MASSGRLFRLSFGAAVAVLAMMLGLWGGQAQAAPGPVDPEEIAQAERIDAGRPFVSPTGEQIVVWKVDGGPERPLAVRSRGGDGFGPIEELSIAGNAQLPEVVFNQQGYAYAIWPVRTVGSLAESALRPPGGFFSSIRPTGLCSFGLSVAVSDQGKLALACSTYRSTAPHYNVGYRVADQVQQIAPNSFPFASYIDDPYIETETAWGSDGTLAIVISRETTSTTTEIHVVTRNPSGTTTGPQLVKSEADPRWLELGGLDVFPNGTVAVLYSAGDAATGSLTLQLRPAGAATVEVPLAADQARFPQVDDAGLLHMVTTSFSGMTASHSVVTATSAGALSAPIALAGPAGAGLRDFMVADDGSETALFADSAAGSVYVARRPAGAGAFEPAIRIAASGARSPEAALTPTGDVMVVWTREAAPDDDRVVVGGLDSGARPTLGPVHIPARVVAGEPVRFSASAADSMGIRSLTWKFGDGGAASGGSVSHAFAKSGNYAVEVTATDRAGNATSQTATLKAMDATAVPRDRRPARLRLRGQRKVKFKVLKRRGARYRVRSNERVRLVAQLVARPRRARISAVGDFVLAERAIHLNRRARNLRLRPKPRLLRGKARNLRLRVRFVATDRGGNSTVITRPLRVRRR